MQRPHQSQVDYQQHGTACVRGIGAGEIKVQALSPFCVLDELDAPLDESNRLLASLRQRLQENLSVHIVQEDVLTAVAAAQEERVEGLPTSG